MAAGACLGDLGVACGLEGREETAEEVARAVGVHRIGLDGCGACLQGMGFGGGEEGGEAGLPAVIGADEEAGERPEAGLEFGVA